MCFLVNMRNKLMQCTCFQPTQLVIIQASIMSVFTYVLLYVGYSVVWCQQDNKTGIAESMFFIFSIQCLAGKTRKVLSILVYFSLFVLFLIAEISTMNIYCHPKNCHQRQKPYAQLLNFCTQTMPKSNIFIIDISYQLLLLLSF